MAWYAYERAIDWIGCTGPLSRAAGEMIRSQMPAHMYVRTQEPQNIAIAKDGTVTVELKSNPTTGYTWYVLVMSPKRLTQGGGGSPTLSPQQHRIR